MADERASMEEALARVDSASLLAIPLLPYRRVLGDAESTEVRSRLRNRWGADGTSYWFPLASPRPTGMEAFQAPWLLYELPATELQGILGRRGIDRLWEIREGGPDYLIDRSLFEANYNGQEGYWTSEGPDWILYASHESSITIGGWLLDVVRTAWPQHRDHIYEGWEFEWPPSPG
jgi:hypothetical protein